MRKPLNPYRRILDAVEKRGTGVRLTYAECAMLSIDTAIRDAAANIDAEEEDIAFMATERREQEKWELSQRCN
jgi:hypothetical protein